LRFYTSNSLSPKENDLFWSFVGFYDLGLFIEFLTFPEQQNKLEILDLVGFLKNSFIE